MKLLKLRLKEERPLLYLSGNGSSSINEMDLIKLGSKYRCFSYAYTCKGAFYYNKRMNQALKTSVDNNIGVMMDSAAHSIHHLKAQGLKKNKGKFNIHDIDKLRDLVMDQYVEYVNKEGKHWDFHINFDYIK